MRALWTHHAPHVVVVRRLVGTIPTWPPTSARKCGSNLPCTASFRGDAQFGTVTHASRSWTQRAACQTKARVRRVGSREAIRHRSTGGERALLAASIEAAAKLSLGARTVFLLTTSRLPRGVPPGSGSPPAVPSRSYSRRARSCVLLAHLVDAPANTRLLPEPHVAPPTGRLAHWATKRRLPSSRALAACEACARERAAYRALVTMAHEARRDRHPADFRGDRDRPRGGPGVVASRPCPRSVAMRGRGFLRTPMRRGQVPPARRR